MKRDSVQLGAAIPGAVESLKRTGILPLKQLFAVDDKSPYYNETVKANVFYTSAWALIHMLTFSPKYSQKVSEFVTAVATGQSSEGALVRSFHQPLATVEQDLREYVQHGLLLSASLPGIADVRDSSGAAKPMKNSEIKRVLGELPRAPRQKRPKLITNANKRESNGHGTASPTTPETESNDTHASPPTPETKGEDRPSVLRRTDDDQPRKISVPSNEGTAQGTPIADTWADQLKLARLAQPEAAPPSPTLQKTTETISVTGRFMVLECLGRSARIVLESERGKEKFLVSDSGNVVIGGRNGAAVDLSCGMQKGIRVHIGYERLVSDPSVVGVVKSIQFDE